MENKRKTDRRTLYTRQTIKNVFLEELKRTSYGKMTVSEICKKAEINRGTFYLHYLDLDDVLDDIFTGFLSGTTSLVDHVLCPLKETCTYPFCQKIQLETHYQPLFMDELTAAKLLKKFADTGKETFVTYLMQNSHLTFEEAEAIFYFQMNGCLAINKLMIQNHCTDWTKIQKTIDRFLKAGLETFILDRTS